MHARLFECFYMDREAAMLTNVGQLLERRGKEFLGSAYKDPISSFSHFQEFSVSNPEVEFVHEFVGASLCPPFYFVKIEP